MKKVLFALVAMSLLFTACEDGNDDFIKLKEVDDVCTMMDDLELMEHCYEEYDVNKDGKVSMSEAAAVTEIDTYVDRSIKGLEYFINLTDIEIKFCEGCTMDLDFRPFKNLCYLCLYYYGDNESEINLSANKSLQRLYLGGLNFPKLDITNLTNLQILDLNVNVMSDLDLGKLSSELQHLDLNIGISTIKKIDLSNLPKLAYLRLYANINDKLDLSNLSELEELRLGAEASKGLDISKNTKLKTLQCYVSGDLSNPMDLDLSNHKLLETLILVNTSGKASYMANLDLSKSTNLRGLDIDKNIFMQNLNLNVANLGSSVYDEHFSGFIVYDSKILLKVPESYKRMTIQVRGPLNNYNYYNNLWVQRYLSDSDYVAMDSDEIYGNWSYTIKYVD